jgi:YesN/AraC family two-component response regulator
MAHDTTKDNRKFIEFSNLFVDYTDGDVAIFDNVVDFEKKRSQLTANNIILLCINGETEIELKDSKTEVKKDDILFCPSNVNITRCNKKDDFGCKVLCLSTHIIQGLLRDKSDVWHSMTYADKPSVVHLSEQAHKEFELYYSIIFSKLNQPSGKTHYEIVQALIRALLLEICFMVQDLRGNIGEQKMSQGRVLFNKFLSLVSNNSVKRQPITDYASKLAITPKYLTMLCLKYSNKTASEWVIQYTIEDIRFYLRNSNLSIKEISAKMGFANMSHFGSYVRKHLGVSPTEFRNMV